MLGVLSEALIGSHGMREKRPVAPLNCVPCLDGDIGRAEPEPRSTTAAPDRANRSWSSRPNIGRKAAETLTFALNRVQCRCLNGGGYWPRHGVSGPSKAEQGGWRYVHV